jgi:hypothetical protein
VNTRRKILIAVSIVCATVVTFISFWTIDKQPSRRIAQDAGPVDSSLTDSQRQKWSIVEQFSLQKKDQDLEVTIPHKADLCEHNTYIHFTLKAYQVTVAGQNPEIRLTLLCQDGHPDGYIYNFSHQNLKSLHKEPSLRQSDYLLSARNLYSDEEFPGDWLLAEITVEGNWGFTVNEFEIQKVFGHNFEFQILP